MNSKQTKKLNKIINQINTIYDKIDDIKCEIQVIKDQVFDDYESMPESKKKTKKGSMMHYDIGELQSAIDNLHHGVCWFKDAVEKIKNAKQ